MKFSVIRRVFLLFTILLASYLISIGVEYVFSIPSDAIVINDPWQLVTPGFTASEEITNTFVLNIEKSPNYSEGLYRISSKFYVDKEISNGYLVITQQPNYGFRVWIDKKYIIQKGDLEHGLANIWKESGIFPIPYTLNKGTHNITIELYAMDEVSLANSPYIINLTKHLKKFMLIKLLNENIIFFMMGLTVTIGVLFISLGFINKGTDKKHFFLGIAFILWGIFFLDFISIERLMISSLLYRKILISCFILGFYLNYGVVMHAINGYISKKHRVLIFLSTSISLFFLIFPSTYNGFTQGRIIVNFINFVFLFFVLLSPKILNSNSSRFDIISIGIVSTSFFGIRYFVFSLIGKPYTSMIHLGLFIYLLFIFIYFICDYVDKNNSIVSEKRRADHYYNKSVIDPLTNVNNRNILSYVQFESNDYLIIICDLDDFKDINDIYGHAAGDEVLIRFTLLVKKYVRETDYIIRLGGDEFIIMLIGCSITRGEILMKNIWNEISNNLVCVEDKSFKYSVSAGGILSPSGEDFETSLKRADVNLYKVKNKSKGTFKFS
ncbi:GGDEF domain-containing protein [Thiospirochaeta perfilievii]|uniref:diguanylate cyclase n=1 Tax=Thiospirochaeta perfilievii TaxID=252967 RepID=A0A5C1QC87_9SPIO|nr:GGDEF domain-containing protein [Thiospirochaeta perfilievii]QEN04284.1 GGDEF domain-containing protein [Thiospirochaeta perfilievii]